MFASCAVSDACLSHESLTVHEDNVNGRISVCNVDILHLVMTCDIFVSRALWACVVRLGGFIWN